MEKIKELEQLQKKFETLRHSNNSMEHSNFLMKMIRVFENVRYTIDEKGKHHFHENIDWTPYIEFHYRIMTDKGLPDEAQRQCSYRFSYHEEEGGRFLLNKIENKEDSGFYPQFIYLLGVIYQHKEGEEKIKALFYARRFAESTDNLLRETAIKVIGWLGSETDLTLLEEHMFNDPNPKCRAWASSAIRFLKMEDKAGKTLPILKRAIETETDAFALGVKIDMAQELAKKKWLTRTALDHIDTEAIQKAGEKALRYLRKLLPDN